MLKITIALLAVLSPLFVLAHGDSQSFELVKEGYLIDIGYNEDLVAGDTVRFDLNLYKEDPDETPVPFSRVWVRVTSGERVLFAGSISDSAFGTPGWSLAFADRGEYILFVRFEDAEGSIVEAEFPMLVAGDEDTETASPSRAVLIGSIGFILGAIGGAFVRRDLKR